MTARPLLMLLAAALALPPAALANPLARFLPAESAAGCDLLSKDDVARHFPAAPPTLSVRVREKPYPSCTFQWQPLAQAERKVGGQLVRLPGQGRLTITRAPVRDPDADWRRVMASFRDEAVAEVQDVGRRGAWSARRSQLSVLGESHVVHVMVEDSDAPGEVQARAVSIARQLLEAE